MKFVTRSKVLNTWHSAHAFSIIKKEKNAVSKNRQR